MFMIFILAACIYVNFDFYIFGGFKTNKKMFFWNSFMPVFVLITLMLGGAERPYAILSN